MVIVTSPRIGNSSSKAITSFASKAENALELWLRFYFRRRTCSKWWYSLFIMPPSQLAGGAGIKGKNWMKSRRHFLIFQTFAHLCFPLAHYHHPFFIKQGIRRFEWLVNILAIYWHYWPRYWTGLWLKINVASNPKTCPPAAAPPLHHQDWPPRPFTFLSRFWSILLLSAVATRCHHQIHHDAVGSARLSQFLFLFQKNSKIGRTDLFLLHFYSGNPLIGCCCTWSITSEQLIKFQSTFPFFRISCSTFWHLFNRLLILHISWHLLNVWGHLCKCVFPTKVSETASHSRNLHCIATVFSAKMNS